MRVEFIRELPIKAVVVKSANNVYERDLPIGNSYEVEEIMMGQSSTSIKLVEFPNERFNSIVFDFYLHDKEIDIYGSGLLSPYFWQKLPMIQFNE